MQSYNLLAECFCTSIDISSLKKEHYFFFFLSWETIWLETELQLKTRQRRPPANWKTREYKLSNPTMFSLLIDQLLLYIYTNYKSWRFPSLPCRRNVLCTFSALRYDLSSPISSPSLSVPGSLLTAAFCGCFHVDLKKWRLVIHHPFVPQERLTFLLSCV